MKYKNINALLKKIKNNKKCLITIKSIFSFCCIYIITFINNEKKPLRLAICTMARKENLYIKEYIDYYLKLGFDHIYIFDDNDKNSENITYIIGNSYKDFVTIYDYRRIIRDQKVAFTLCYEMNKYKYDWIFMNDIDEYLVIKKDSLKHYISGHNFKKCDFIKFHWIVAKDNNLLHYDNRTLFERFKGPYLKDTHIKTMVRGNIDDIQFDIHTPFISPHRNVSCNNRGIVYKNKEILFQDVFDINIDRAYIIHFKYKSTEEYINKYKRGYRWENSAFMKMRIKEYFHDNDITMEKIDYIEKELHLNLSKLKKNIK